MASSVLKDTGELSPVRLNFEKQEWDVHLNKLPEELVKTSTLCLCGDGTYLVRRNMIGTFCRKYEDTRIPGGDAGPAPYFSFALPKIPRRILKQQVSFYKKIMAKWNRAEAFSIILFDKEKQEYFLHIPKQRITKGSVHYAQADLRKTYPSDRYLEVASCHSHNDMGAWFSSTDDRDEQGDMLYMVMGTLDKTPTFKLRASVAGKQCLLLSIDEIFEITEDEWKAESLNWVDLDDHTWFDNINVEADYKSAHFSTSGSNFSTREYSGWDNYGWSFNDNDDARSRLRRRMFKEGKLQSFGPKQLELDNLWGGESFKAEDSDTTALLSVIKDFWLLANTTDVSTALEVFIQDLLNEGFGEDLYYSVIASVEATELFTELDDLEKTQKKRRADPGGSPDDEFLQWLSEQGNDE